MLYLITVVDLESVDMVYLSFNVDFITLTVTGHRSTEVSGRVGFCMYVYVKKFKRALICMQ